MLGGKLIGAGGCDSLLFYVEPEKQESVRLAMKKLIYILSEFYDEGTRVIPLYTENVCTSEIIDIKIYVIH